MSILLETLARVRADRLVANYVHLVDVGLLIGGELYRFEDYHSFRVIGLGKAACQMAMPFRDLSGAEKVEGLLATRQENAEPVGPFRVVFGSHPFPDDSSVHAGQELLTFARASRPDDLVIVLLSGGASALAELPAEGLDVRDLAMTSRSLMAAGADIVELNRVRGCLSLLKSGGLARACGDATLVCLVLSDVVGNHRNIVGSGPCWGDSPSGEEAMQILQKYQVPVQEAVQRRLRTMPKLQAVKPPHHVVGDIYTLLEEAQHAATAQGLRPRIDARPFHGEARTLGAGFAAEALSLSRNPAGFDCFIAAGESTVTLRGNGYGGRNQEMACAAALALQGEASLAMLACGTDGVDGPTDAAGGLVDGDTANYADFRRALDQNDSYPELTKANALIQLPPTGTNLNDIVIACRVSD